MDETKLIIEFADKKEEKKESSSEKFKNIALGTAGVITSILIPLIGYFFSQAQKDKEIAKSYIELGTNILNGKPEQGQDTALRSWAIGLINHYSEVKLTREAQEEVKKAPLYTDFKLYPLSDTSSINDNSPKLVSAEQLKSILPDLGAKESASILKQLNTFLPKYNINTPLRISAFIAEIAHESMNFKYNEELTSEKRANKMYANKMGNGDEQSGDGWKYRGRGFVLLAGKNLYKELTKSTGIDFINHPDLLKTQYPLTSACLYWSQHTFNKDADKDDLITITKKIDGGLAGLDDRMAIYQRAKKAFHISN